MLITVTVIKTFLPIIISFIIIANSHYKGQKWRCSVQTAESQP